jgi:hypothetical protein
MIHWFWPELKCFEEAEDRHERVFIVRKFLGGIFGNDTGHDFGVVGLLRI